MSNRFDLVIGRTIVESNLISGSRTSIRTGTYVEYFYGTARTLYLNPTLEGFLDPHRRF